MGEFAPMSSDSFSIPQLPDEWGFTDEICFENTQFPLVFLTNNTCVYMHCTYEVPFFNFSTTTIIIIIIIM
jgi:hypothetical protein